MTTLIEKQFRNSTEMRRYEQKSLEIIIKDWELFLLFKDMHYNTTIHTFCILKKMTFSAFHYLTLSVRCEELDAHIN
jgi:hypothetical protein